MAIEKNKMSQDQYDKLKAELDYLETVRTREVAELLKEARSFGDLSENSEYDEAKNERDKLYSKIAEIHAQIENAEIIEAEVVEQGVVSLGCKVTVLDLEDNSEDTFQIVGSQEANPMAGKISDESPVGRGLIGHKEGETVVVKAPAGEMMFRVVKVEHN